MIKKIIKKTQKAFAVLLTLSLIVAYSLPIRALAQEVTPDPTPTPTSTEVTNGATDTNTVDTTANTGDNTIGEPTPTPIPDASITETTPTETPTPTPEPTPEDTSITSETPLPTEGGVEATNSASLTNDVASSADSGNNTIEEPTPTPTPTSDTQTSEQETQETQENGNTDSAQINTGDAVAVTTVDNDINSTQINAQVVYQTINLFVDQNGDINLSDPAALVQLLTSQYPNEEVINVALTSITNTAELTNTVNSTANTGNNTINQPEGSGTVTTGDAYSLISALNRVNFVMIDSVLHVVTINIFGDFIGNIILPEYENSGEPCSDCGTSTSIENNATVTNTVDSQAITGQNSITATESSQISTGEAVSIVQLTNLVNTNLIGVDLFRLIILPFGTWDGSFLGWGFIDGQEGGQPLTVSSLSGVSGNGCPTCTGDVSIDNHATLNNTMSSTANSGGNSVNATNGSINTGRSISLVSLINLVNTNFIRSRGFFGFINIFGNWTGNIGGASYFVENEGGEPVEEESPTETQTQTVSDAPYQRESGGKLEISQTNNVGEYVLPGDTVTFFIKVKNPGAGRVYDTKLTLRLIKDGKDMGGVNFDLGTIDPERGLKITTGLVLSSQTPGGTYLARATVVGVTGPENSPLEATADSSFAVFGTTTATTVTQEPPGAESSPTVLGVTKPSHQTPNILLALLVLLLLIPEYVTFRVVKDRALAAYLFRRSEPVLARLHALRMLLL